MFTAKDIEQIEAKGISIDTIQKQIECFRNGFPFIDLHAPATIDHGLKKFSEEQIQRMVKAYPAAIKHRHLLKFVPASGAASRMFKDLFSFTEKFSGSEKDIEHFENENSFAAVRAFIKGIKDFAFYEDLKKVMSKAKLDINEYIEKKQYHTIVDFLLSPKGLGYAEKPKALLKFHQYSEGSRTPIDEHLVECIEYCRDDANHADIHFTLSHEHESDFLDYIKKTRTYYEKKFNIRFRVSYSKQKPSTDTIAVDLKNEPFREADNTLLFRPGGHGALIENLNDIDADIIFIKNIDNIVPDSLKEMTITYKKIIATYMIGLQQTIFRYLVHLISETLDESFLAELEAFMKDDLNIVVDYPESLPIKEKQEIIIAKLNKPIRVCGMVKNEGEPGGGPFWVKNEKGNISLQIVESSQINTDDKTQKDIFSSSTHFNPVDLVCGVRDFMGNKFFLPDYVDEKTGFISVKSKDGKDLKAMELPGLWNGAMADWITVFVEVPLITFNPVKTVNDLLRPEHK